MSDFGRNLTFTWTENGQPSPRSLKWFGFNFEGEVVSITGGAGTYVSDGAVVCTSGSGGDQCEITLLLS